MVQLAAQLFPNHVQTVKLLTIVSLPMGVKLRDEQEIKGLYPTDEMSRK
jgi:hypothetical protein